MSDEELYITTADMTPEELEKFKNDPNTWVVTSNSMNADEWRKELLDDLDRMEKRIELDIEKTIRIEKFLNRFGFLVPVVAGMIGFFVATLVIK